MKKSNMKVLYVYRKPNKQPYPWKRWKRLIKERLFWYLLKGQDGFFEGALWTVFPDLKLASIEYAIKKASIIDKIYDWIIVNAKCYGKNKSLSQQDLSWLKSFHNCHKALFLNYANTYSLPAENVLDIFDVIFKRELLKDPDRYNIKSVTKQKLYPTMLSCPLIQARVLRPGKKFYTNSLNLKTKKDFEYDVTFIGADTNPLRRQVLLKLEKSSINFHGGLYDHISRLPLDWEGLGYPMKKMTDYLNMIIKSRINLAMDGKGVFTFRHLELWYTASFMLSSSSILKIQLPGDTPEDGVHFASFKDYDELKEKILFYLSNEKERSKIALAGRKFFQSIYDFSKHGKYIDKILNEDVK